MLLQGQGRKRNTVSFGSPRRYSHEGALSMGMPDAQVASSLRSGVDLLKQSLDNGASCHTGQALPPLQLFGASARLQDQVMLLHRASEHIAGSECWWRLADSACLPQ